MQPSRDLIGYGHRGAHFDWPNGSRFAINFVINYETGAERSPIDGDSESESYLTDIPGCSSRQGQRHLSVESMFEYGSRCGIWRLHRLFDSFELPVTVFACGRALAANPEYAAYLKDSPHEVAGHGYQWIDYASVPSEVECEHMKKTIAIIKDLTAKTVYGWYTGRRSEVTNELVSDAGLQYQSDSYADDLPYWITVKNQPQLVIPYTLVTNDFRYATAPGFSCSNDFYLELIAAFDRQYAEAQQSPQLLTIGLHDRLSGRPSRAEAIHRFLQYIIDKPNVWITTRASIADFFQQSRRP